MARRAQQTYRWGGTLVVLGVAAAAPANLIDFDHNAAGVVIVRTPVFGDANVLTETYASLGVHFAGPTGTTGGMILSGTTNSFNVLPTSGANFLAFNNSLAAPRGPETIKFDDAWGYVAINVAGAIGTATFRMQAYDASNVLLATATVSTKVFAPLLVQADGIRKVVITNTTAGSSDYYAMDDLTYFPVPEPTAVGVLTVAAAGLLRRSRRAKPGNL